MDKLLYINQQFKQFIYRVCQDESIFDIAIKFNTTPQLIIDENSLDRYITTNDILIITRQIGDLYTVTPFDSIESICLKFNVSKEQIFKQNKIDYVYPYQLILI